jgi:hypothetical protein
MYFKRPAIYMELMNLEKNREKKALSQNSGNLKSFFSGNFWKFLSGNLKKISGNLRLKKS